MVREEEDLSRVVSNYEQEPLSIDLWVLFLSKKELGELLE